tara:strand:+ start:374 stop:664 length:291 start_codon:yes stop_codon:yes gene_type:complete
MSRPKGSTNKLTTEVKNKLQTVMDDVVSQLDIAEMTTDQKIKMLQIGLQYLLPKLKHVSEEKEHKDVPLFIDIISRDENGEGWETERRPLNIGDSE